MWSLLQRVPQTRLGSEECFGSFHCCRRRRRSEPSEIPRSLVFLALVAL